MTISMREDANDGAHVDLSAILKLVEERDEVSQAIEKAEEHLNSLKKRYEHLDGDILPNTLRELGLSQVKLNDGRIVGYVDKYKTHISDAHRKAAMAELRKRGFANIIDNTITLKFTAAQSDTADEAKKLLEESGYSFIQKEAVHHARLTSWVTERVSEGDDIPLELFGAHIVTKTKVKAGRK